MEYYLSRREFGGIGIRKFNEFLDNNSELIPETLILYSKLFSIYLAKTRCFIIIKCSPNLIKKKKKIVASSFIISTCTPMDKTSQVVTQNGINSN